MFQQTSDTKSPAVIPHRISKHGKRHYFQLPAQHPGFRRCGQCSEYTTATREVCHECELIYFCGGHTPSPEDRAQYAAWCHGQEELLRQEVP